MLMEKSCQNQILVDQYATSTGCKKYVVRDEEANYTQSIQADSETLYNEFQSQILQTNQRVLRMVIVYAVQYNTSDFLTINYILHPKVKPHVTITISEKMPVSR